MRIALNNPSPAPATHTAPSARSGSRITKNTLCWSHIWLKCAARATTNSSTRCARRRKSSVSLWTQRAPWWPTPLKKYSNPRIYLSRTTCLNTAANATAGIRRLYIRKLERSARRRVMRIYSTSSFNAELSLFHGLSSIFLFRRRCESSFQCDRAPIFIRFILLALFLN